MTTEKSLAIKTDALPTTFEEIRGMADAFVRSGMFSDAKQQAQAIVKIQAGRELGLPPVYSMQNINMIRDRLTTSANTIAMMVKRSGKYNYRVKEHTDTVCLIIFYENDNGKFVETGESKFTIDDAKRANLVRPDSGWVKFPRAMLFSRAISQGARIYTPDAIGGIYTDEEIRSIPPRPEEEPVKDSQPEPPAVAEQDPPDKQDEQGGPEKPERDISTIKTSTDLYRACQQDWPNTFKTSKEVNKELGINSWADCSDTPAECYRRIKAVRKAPEN
jgi:hypothetical protein